MYLFQVRLKENGQIVAWSNKPTVFVDGTPNPRPLLAKEEQGVVVRTQQQPKRRLLMITKLNIITLTLILPWQLVALHASEQFGNDEQLRLILEVITRRLAHGAVF